MTKNVMKNELTILWTMVLLAIVAIGRPAVAQLDFEKPPVNYGAAESADPVALFVRSMELGESSLERDSRLGWLPSLLERLDIDPESQVLVFSKTSLQLQKISPRTPRAIYFNDDVYVGYCQNGDLLEIAATDSQLGAVFYSLDQFDRQPKIVADRGQCLSCHATNRTQGVPGYLVRSVYPDFGGRPRAGTRSYVTDHRTEFSQRFGGWYVTGQHGSIRHMGNGIANRSEDPEEMDFDSGANRTDLTEFFKRDPYLTPHSDIVALMLLEHQTQMHNLLARASMETRCALYHDEGINQALGRPPGTQSESTQRRIARAADDLIRYMLFADEHHFESPIQGNTPFAERFEARSHRMGQVDGRGRSLRQFELQTRLFRYPCSYLIYSDAFRNLPAPIFDYVRQKMYAILSADEAPAGYDRLSNGDREAIREILDETMPELFEGLSTESNHLSIRLNAGQS
jgi:hypothetical protein